MKIHNIKLNSSLVIENVNLAIGNFDGLHLGHQKIIEKLIHESKIMKINPSVLCFSPHPREFFSSRKNNNFNIISDSLKAKLLGQLGVKHYIVLNFDQGVASLSPQEFIKSILVEKLNIKNLVVGYDFKFGKDRLGDVSLLKEQSSIYNFTVNVLKQIKLKKSSEVFSSSLIRKNIQEGNIEKVNYCLGRNWSMEGVVISGDKNANKMGFPTANIIPPNLIHPKKGVYVVKILYAKTVFKGIANFGVRPTVKGDKLLLEVHLFDFNSNLYGKDLTIEFLAFIREEKKFENFNLLKQQIDKDILLAKDYHSKK